MTDDAQRALQHLKDVAHVLYREERMDGDAQRDAAHTITNSTRFLEEWIESLEHIING